MRYITLVLLLLCMRATILAQQAKVNASFKPGELWSATDGSHINAHGGGMIFHGGKYYWFGEHKVEGRGGNTARVGDSASAYKQHFLDYSDCFLLSCIL